MNTNWKTSIYIQRSVGVEIDITILETKQQEEKRASYSIYVYQLTFLM